MTEFKVGDRVRLEGAAWGRHFPGVEVATLHATPDGTPCILDADGLAWYPSDDPGNRWYAPLHLETAESHENRDFTQFPETAEYADPRHEALIRQVEALQAVIRRRNEEIAEQQRLLRVKESELAEADDLIAALRDRLKAHNDGKLIINGSISPGIITFGDKDKF